MAKVFRFRFETMLKIRRQREDERKRVVADRLHQIAQVRKQMHSVDRQIAEEIDAIRNCQIEGTIDLQQTVRHRNWLTQLRRAALDAQSRLQFHETRLAQDRAALAEATKQRRILEKLKERQWSRHETGVRKAETREADDAATVRYVFARLHPEQTVRA
jgi:flagellar FliJ protein